MKCKIRDNAREYFDKSIIDKEKLKVEDIKLLSRCIDKELNDYYFFSEHAKQMDMKVSSLRKSDIIIKKDKFEAAKIGIDGSYFKRREGITFATSGFIGIGGEFSDCNVIPICNGFMKWIDLMSR